MNLSHVKPNLYSLPIKINTSHTVRTYVINLILLALFIGMSLILPINEPGAIFLKVIFIVMALFIVYLFVLDVVIKKFYLELTEEGVYFRNTFSLKKLKWTEVAHVQTYCLNNNTFIGIITKDRVKPNYFKSIYSMSIPIRSFSKADPEKLFATMKSKSIY